MRIIEVCDAPIQTVAVSPDSRYVAASGMGDRFVGGTFAVFHWATGEPVLHLRNHGAVHQLAFSARGQWVIHGVGNTLNVDVLDPALDRPPGFRGGFTGGLTVSPDGRLLVAVEGGAGRNDAKLARWSLPGFREISGFDYWAPLQRLAFSPNGHFLAGLWSGYRTQWRSESPAFELRYAASGGLDFRHHPHDRRALDSVGFVSFTHDNSTCVFGWANEFFVLDVSTGTKTGEVKRVEASFNHAAFTGSGRHFATVEVTGVLKLWDVASWQVVREYDWQCGALTCVAFTADGTAGVCGTETGHLVQFDVDE